MSRLIARGALIVLEGCDRSGKSTQCEKLLKSLCDEKISTKFMRFPDRTTIIGGMCSDYLKNSKEFEDHAIHLLFSANRWELVPQIVKLLKEGTTVVIDRYAYSGVVYTAVKEGMNIEWCKNPDSGIPRPDAVIYLTIDREEAEKRGGYGKERYEKREIQEKVKQTYELLKTDKWKVIDANGEIEDIHKEIKQHVITVVEHCKFHPIHKLWRDNNESF